MMSFRTLLLTAIATALPAFASSAFADTLPNIPASCFTYSLNGHQAASHGFSASGMHATLTGTGIGLDIGPISLKDPKGAVEESKLEQFNATAAYAALSAFRGGLSPACQGQDATITVHNIHEGTPEASWSSVKLSRPGHTMTIQHATINAVETNPDLRMKVNGTGIHDSKQPLIPSALSADLSIHGLSGASQQITINALHAISGSSTVDGAGTIQIGSSAATSTADTHVSITNIADLIEKIRQTAPTKVVTALTIARLMGKQNGDTTSWDIALQGGVVTVNRIPLPIAVP
ncbi:hypothetical protein AD940_07125 [Gluconobacter thailandicus]|uniref:DUF2125 domain-containing protein n=1 Tax=Gluconobacter thailandicus TaxID=257438 RepID=UPI000777F012|nr:DUF2125 domain-containing protein [Gluconobacter thailandicus]KXV34392.1 hypothetical protein AD940_07125 [Gluconobacter thailandicus]